VLDEILQDLILTTMLCVCCSSDFEKGLKDVNPIDKIISIRGANLGLLEFREKDPPNSQDLRVLIPIQLAFLIYAA
jgi:putative ABC transport system permease protein